MRGHRVATIESCGRGFPRHVDLQSWHVAGAFQRRGLRKAAEALGGEEQLRRFLDVPSADLSLWIRSPAPIPDAVFRKVVNLLADIEAGIPPPAGSAPMTVPPPR